VGELVLSLFPGIGLLDMAFEEEGFTVVRGPDVLWGGNIARFHPPAGHFAGVIGGPPCQAFSDMATLVAEVGQRQAENLIPEFERCVQEALPAWFLMENVPGAPEPRIDGYASRSTIINNRWVAEAPEQNRVRRFTFGRGSPQADAVDLGPLIDVTLFENPRWESAVMASNGRRRYSRQEAEKRARGREDVTADDLGRRRTVAECARLQGLPEDFLSKAPFTTDGKRLVIGNGVPLPLGRAIAAAVRRVLDA